MRLINYQGHLINPEHIDFIESKTRGHQIESMIHFIGGHSLEFSSTPSSVWTNIKALMEKEDRTP